ncbi:hypothetical protein AK812_SmicGene9274 [Symbiodinium microadriaticum]|uniref:Uncharacterized protein n=1 Tax=Symbiodinium microadriaticum TaxID=2951 RepID=A0A1Q9EJ02_SYMMI|nr:hypothetical protein AK812_SmicGene9274 [Symbiodinium microadriaticum]
MDEARTAPSALGGDGTLAVRDTGEQLRRQVQRALTTSKRCETKMRKLAETKETRQIQWKAWKEQLKASFLKQQQQFEKDQAALETEIATLRSQGEDAAKSMQQLVLHGPAAMELDASVEAAADGGAWDALMSSSASEVPVTDFMRQAYALAQMAVQRQGSLCPPEGQRGLGVMPPQMMERMVGCPPVPTTGPIPGAPMDGQMPGQRIQEGQTMPSVAHSVPPYSAAGTDQVRAGPFSRSPMAGGMSTEGHMSRPSPAGPVQTGPPGLTSHAPIPPEAPTTTSAEANTAGPPLQPVPLPGGDAINASPLVDMLRAKRQETRRVMEPFGGAKPNADSDAQVADAGRPPGEVTNQEVPFIEDDDEPDPNKGVPARNSVQAGKTKGRCIQQIVLAECGLITCRALRPAPLASGSTPNYSDLSVLGEFLEHIATLIWYLEAAPHEATDVPVVCEPPVDLLPEQTCYSVSRQNATLGQAAGDDEVPHAAYKGPSAATPNLQAAVSHAVADANVAMLPAPFHRIGDIPPEHPHHQAATEDDDDEAETVLDAVFLIFSQDTTAEQVRLRLTIPCSVDDALLALAESCDHDKYLRFPDHTPARPQPSQWWIAVIAQPAWASEEPTVLLNLSSVDGRCFVASAPHFFSRSQIFRLAGLADDGSFEVFPFTAHEPMTAEDEVRLIPCGTVTICRAGGRRVIHGNFIENMLLSGTMWDADPALPSPPAGERSLLIHGHGSGVIHPRSGTVPPTADEVAALCGASSSTIRLTTANLAAPDVLSQGYLCQHLFGVSFTEDNLLAAGDAHNYVAFIDCRALLQGWSMETSQDGRLSHEEMTNWMDTFAPHNWQPQIEGAPIEAGFLVVPHGAVLTASYVPVSSSESQAPSEPVQTDAEGEDEVKVSQAGLKVPTTAARSDRIPTNGSDLAAGSLTVGALILTSQAPVADAHCLLSSAQTVGSLSPALTWSLGCVFLLGLMLSIGLHEILFRRPFLFDRPNICHASFGSCEHKISAEPQGGSEQDQTRLDELRSITRQMGGHWPVRLPPSDQEESPPDPDAEEDPDGFGQGWKVACAWDGWLDASGVLNDLDDLRPRGWQLRFAGAHEHTEFLSTSPGQILTLILVPAQVLANQGQGNPSQLPVGDDAPLGPEHQPAGAGNGHVAYPDGEHVTGHDDGGGDEGTEGSDVPAPTNLHFALLTPEYTPEYLSIPSELPVPLPRILVLIAHARDPGRKRIFPRLLPVRVQPALTYASVLALPDWDYEGVSVAIACDLPQFRIFADIVPSHLVRDEVLRLAGLDEDAHVAVFLNDIPWAYQGAARLYVVDGDLIRICSLMHQVVPPIEFTRLFDTAEGWHDEPELPGPFDDCFWLLSDQWPRRFRVGIEPRLPIATALAESLGTAEGDLVVAPATGPVRDHAHSGFPSRQIMLAVQLELEGDVPFVLDQRPLLLGMQWAFARAGRVDVQTLCQCHQRRCPPGYFLRVIGGFAAGDIGNHFRFVYPGQLIVVEYWPRRFSPGHHFDDRPPPDDGDDDDADRPPDPENDSTSDVQGQSAASSSSRPDAGTGLTALVCCWIRVYSDGFAIGPPSFGYDTPLHALHPQLTVSILSSRGFALSVSTLEDALALLPGVCGSRRDPDTPVPAPVFFALDFTHWSFLRSCALLKRGALSPPLPHLQTDVIQRYHHLHLHVSVLYQPLCAADTSTPSQPLGLTSPAGIKGSMSS